MDEPAARPFDASVILLAEALGSVPADWSTISLAKYIRDSVLTPPSRRSDPVGAGVKILQAISALTDRGLDASAFVRYGLGPRLGDIIAAFASLPQLLALVPEGGTPEGISQILETLPEELESWSHLCAADASPKKKSVGSGNPEGVLLNSLMEITHDWHGRVNVWIQQASLSELIGWACPVEEVFDSLVGHEIPDVEIGEHYGWIVDRLTETYLSDWSEKSLHLEFRWQKGGMPNVFPDVIFNLRPVQCDALNAEIAERAAMGASDRVQRETVEQLEIQAGQLVKAGHRDQAASIYRMILKIAPGDVGVRNNLGFSLIPDDPRKALRHLTAAARSGYDQPFINAHNRMMCNLLIGVPKEALQIAENVWNSSMVEQMVPAILWGQQEGEWVICHVPDARSEVAKLALSAAQILGGEAFDVWKNRLRVVAEVVHKMD
ncbi:tetratricopeptide repeat protein [Streptomyces sp. SID12501]|uniref:Tetratricopeptide repeat protein n=1 Tax=Streptomyces sp. SID12501 TaxID=2706042 RepID=A0A6B3BQL9_9ACTN|nr:hypothetical protein [Streptomyces sp. SID12501]NEC86613.1 hypothetical protein [Streptomyces sp. SID12501]